MLGIGIGIPRIGRITLGIGDTYQGGVIFYLDGSGGGLIAAPSDQSTGAVWGCNGTNITGAAGTAIGTGAQNTIDILAECSTADIAADVCRDLTIGAYSDWFLPSKLELKEMYDNRAIIGNFTTSIYWSSTESSSQPTIAAWYIRFNDGYFASNLQKSNASYVRAIRAF